MTKAELEKDRNEWKQQAESLQDDLDALNEYVTELEWQLAELSNNNSSNGIKDLEDFKSRMRIDGVYTEEIGEFIENYLRYYQ